MIGHALVKPELTGAQVMEGLELAKRHHLRRGAKEIDMVVAISKLLSREFQHVQVELLQMSELCHKEGAIFKIILETAYLTDELKIIACRSAARAEVDFVQTPTGFAPPDATIEDLKLLRKHLPEENGIKAAALRAVDQVIEAHAAGCSRVATDSTAAILEEWKARLAAAPPGWLRGWGKARFPPMHSEYPNILDAGHRGVV